VSPPRRQTKQTLKAIESRCAGIENGQKRPENEKKRTLSREDAKKTLKNH